MQPLLESDVKLLDPEHLLSHQGVDSPERYRNIEGANYVRFVTQWHKSSDGRNLKQLQRCGLAIKCSELFSECGYIIRNAMTLQPLVYRFCYFLG